MHRIDSAGAVSVLPAPTAAGPNPNSYWQDENIGAGQEGTVADQDWFNAVQEELMAILAAAGTAWNKAVRNQVITSIEALIATALSAAETYAAAQASAAQTAAETYAASQAAAAQSAAETYAAGQASAAQTAAETYAASLPLSTAFESAGIALVTPSGALVAHGLGGKPKLVEVFLRCVTAEFGYAVGEEVSTSWFFDDPGFPSRSEGVSVSIVDATNLRYIVGTNLLLPNAASPAGQVTITLANWVLVLRAWL